MDVGNIVPIFNCMKADFVGCTMHNSTLDSPASHPHAESINMMVSTIGTLCPWRSAKLAGEQNDGGVEQASSL